MLYSLTFVCNKFLMIVSDHSMFTWLTSSGLLLQQLRSGVPRFGWHRNKSSWRLRNTSLFALLIAASVELLCYKCCSSAYAIACVCAAWMYRHDIDLSLFKVHFHAGKPRLGTQRFFSKILRCCVQWCLERRASFLEGMFVLAPSHSQKT